MLRAVHSQDLGCRELLHLVLADVLGDVPRIDRTCPHCAEQHGRPVIDHPSWHVSTAHSAGLALVAVTDVGPVGVDVERVDRTGFEGFAGVALGPGEVASDLWQRAVLWTRKEAVLKATGEGLSTDPRTVDVSGSREPVRGAELYDVPVPDGWRASLALLAATRPLLEVR